MVAELRVASPAWIEWDALATSAPDPASPVIVTVVGHAPAPEARARVLAELAARAPAGSRLVVVDHNRPRRLAAALLAVVGPPRVPGRTPAARWRRLADPTARAVQGAGFSVDRLRLVADERVQVVFATRGCSPAGNGQGNTRADGTQGSHGPKNAY